jgi:hypothetical protein
MRAPPASGPAAQPREECERAGPVRRSLTARRAAKPREGRDAQSVGSFDVFTPSKPYRTAGGKAARGRDQSTSAEDQTFGASAPGSVRNKTLG